MDKTTEIKHIQALAKDTYFSQFFTEFDIERMSFNITSDLPIELNCGFCKTDKMFEYTRTINELREELVKAQQKADEIEREQQISFEKQKMDFVKELLLANKTNSDEINAVAISMTSDIFYFKVKIKEKLPLTAKDREMLGEILCTF